MLQYIEVNTIKPADILWLENIFVFASNLVKLYICYSSNKQCTYIYIISSFRPQHHWNATWLQTCTAVVSAKYLSSLINNCWDSDVKTEQHIGVVLTLVCRCVYQFRSTFMSGWENQQLITQAHPNLRNVDSINKTLAFHKDHHVNQQHAR